MFSKIKKFIEIVLLIVPIFSTSERISLDLSFSKVINTPEDNNKLALSYEISPKLPQSQLCVEAAKKIKDVFDVNRESGLSIYKGLVNEIQESAIGMEFLKTEINSKLPFPSINTIRSTNNDIYVSLFLDPNIIPHKEVMKRAKTQLETDALLADNLNLIEINTFFMNFMQQITDGTKVYIPKLPIFRTEPISRKGCSLTGEAADSFQQNLNATRIWYFLMTLSEKYEICLPIGALQEEEGDEINIRMP